VGQVRNPGATRYAARHGTRAHRARAGIHRFRIARSHRRAAAERHAPARITFNYRKITDGTDQDNFLVQAGDIIVVP
jgi:hypothetical protein